MWQSHEEMDAPILHPLLLHLLLFLPIYPTSTCKTLNSTWGSEEEHTSPPRARVLASFAPFLPSSIRLHVPAAPPCRASRTPCLHRPAAPRSLCEHPHAMNENGRTPHQGDIHPPPSTATQPPSLPPLSYPKQRPQRTQPDDRRSPPAGRNVPCFTCVCVLYGCGA